MHSDVTHLQCCFLLSPELQNFNKNRKQAKLSIKVKKILAEIVSIPFSVPLSNTIPQFKHLSSHTTHFSTTLKFYPRCIWHILLQIVYQPHIYQMNPLPFQSRKSDREPKPQKMKKVQKNGIFSRYKTHHTWDFDEEQTEFTVRPYLSSICHLWNPDRDRNASIILHTFLELNIFLS